MKRLAYIGANPATWLCAAGEVHNNILYGLGVKGVIAHGAMRQADDIL